MDPQKSGLKTSELWTVIAAIAGLLGAVLPIVLTYVPPDSRVYGIIAIVAAVAVAVYKYVAQRGDVKVSAFEALTAVNLAAASKPQDPPKPPQP